MNACAWAWVVGADVVVYLVVVAFGIERWINVTKINRLVADKLPHHIKIIAVVEFVHGFTTGNVALTLLGWQQPALSPFVKTKHPDWRGADVIFVRIACPIWVLAL